MSGTSNLQCGPWGDNNNTTMVFNYLPGSKGARWGGNQSCCTAAPQSCMWSTSEACMNQLAMYKTLNEGITSNTPIATCPGSNSSYATCPQWTCVNGNPVICEDSTCQKCWCGGTELRYNTPFTLRTMINYAVGISVPTPTGWLHMADDNNSTTNSATGTSYAHASISPESYGSAPQLATWSMKPVTVKYQKDDFIRFGDEVYLYNLVDTIKTTPISRVSGQAYFEAQVGNAGVMQTFMLQPAYAYQKNGDVIREGEQFYIVVAYEGGRLSVTSVNSEPTRLYDLSNVVATFAGFNGTGDVTFVEAQRKCNANSDCPANYACTKNICVAGGYVTPSPTAPPPSTTKDVCGTVDGINYGQCKDPNTYCNSQHRCMPMATNINTNSPSEPSPVSPVPDNDALMKKYMYAMIGCGVFLLLIMIIVKLLSK